MPPVERGVDPLADVRMQPPSGPFGGNLNFEAAAGVRQLLDEDSHSGNSQPADGCDSAATTADHMDRRGAKVTLEDQERSAEAVEEDLCLQPLLSVSQPVPCGTGQFRLRLVRSSHRQPFGLTFEAIDGRIVVLEDQPQLALQRNDQVLSINGLETISAERCMRILMSSLAVDFLMLRRDASANDADNGVNFGAFAACMPNDNESRPAPFCRIEGSRGAGAVHLRPVLSASRPRITNVTRCEFQVVLQRSSKEQKFGLTFSTEVPGARRQNDKVTIFIKQDMPHLGLQKGDRLISLNGVDATVAGPEECHTRISECLQVELVLRRFDLSEVANTSMVFVNDEEASILALEECAEALDGERNLCSLRNAGFAGGCLRPFCNDRR